MANDVTIRVRVKEQLREELGGLVGTIGALMGSAVVPLAGAVAALGVELVGAGAAAGAFGLAVQPQIANVKQVSTEQDAYNKAVSQYGENSKQALAAQQKLKSDMSQLTPATRDTATAFTNLKTKFSDWSNSLSSSTMPVFTHALNGLSNIFPLLTPLVKAASKEFLGLSVSFEQFTKTDKFKDLVSQFSNFAAGALHNVVTFMKDAAKAAASFATSEGFKNFLEQGKQNLPGVAEALKNLAEFIGRFIKAAGPLGGLQLKVFEVLAQALNAIPLSVLQVLAPLILGAAGAIKIMKLAMMGFDFIRGLVLGFQMLAGATLEVDAAMDANPIGAVVLALSLLVVGLVEAYKHVGWFHDAVKAVFNWLKDHWKLVLEIITGPIGLAVAFVINHWKKIQSGLSSTFNYIKSHWRGILEVLTGPIGVAVVWIVDHWNQISSAASRVVSAIRSHWSTIKSVLISPFESAWSVISGIMSRISSAISSIPGKVSSAVSGAVSSLNPSNWFAHGGVVGAAVGGPRSGLVMVGEQGPELVSLPSGSTVHSNPDTQRMMSGVGGGGGGRLQIEWVGGNASDEFFTWLRRNIRIKGGNVQTVLGANR